MDNPDYCGPPRVRLTVANGDQVTVVDVDADELQRAIQAISHLPPHAMQNLCTPAGHHHHHHDHNEPPMFATGIRTDSEGFAGVAGPTPDLAGLLGQDPPADNTAGVWQIVQLYEEGGQVFHTPLYEWAANAEDENPVMKWMVLVPEPSDGAEG